MLDLAYGAATDRGSVRSINEDSILAEPPVFVVADGIGGNEAGEVASAIVVEEFAALARRPVIDPDDIGATIAGAHRRVQALHDGRPYGACTTAVGAVGIADEVSPYWVVFNVGDSRIYLRAAGEDHLEQISVDHSHVQELVDAGVITAEQALTHPERNLVTRAVGSDDGCEPDYWVLPMVPGDRLLICSDGLFGDTGADELDAATTGPAPAAETADDLIALALRNGARDNVSAVVVDVLPETEPAEAAPTEPAERTEPTAPIDLGPDSRHPDPSASSHHPQHPHDRTAGGAVPEPDRAGEPVRPG